jgi:apolipoprotein N-acyltransferase
VVGLAGAALLACLASLVPFAPGSPDPVAGGKESSVVVAAVQGNVPGQGLEAFAERRAVLDNHVDATLKLAQRVEDGEAQQPDLVIWPENSSDIDPYTDPSAKAAIGDAVQAIGAPLLMGAVVGGRPDSGWHNRAILWSTAGEPGRYYDKTHPVPFGEYIPLRSVLAPHIPALDQIPSDMVPGTRPGLFDVGPARAGVLMCFEVAYDGLVRDLVHGGANLIVVPTNNATYTGTGQIEQQFAMSRLRAIETGRWVVVASTNGISGIVGPDGAVAARAPERVQAVLEREIPLQTRLTPAMRAGAWPELALAGISVVSALAGLLLRYRRRAPAEPGDADRAGPGTATDEPAGAEPAHEHS